MVLTSEVRISPQLQPQEVQVIFRTDSIAQEGNDTVTLELEPLPTTNLPTGKAIFFQKTIDMIITDTDSKYFIEWCYGKYILVNVFSLRHLFNYGGIQNL